MYLSRYQYIYLYLYKYTIHSFITHTHTLTHPEDLIRVIYHIKQSRAVRNLYMKKVLYESMMPSSWMLKEND